MEIFIIEKEISFFLTSIDAKAHHEWNSYIHLNFWKNVQFFLPPQEVVDYFCDTQYSWDTNQIKHDFLKTDLSQNILVHTIRLWKSSNDQRSVDHDAFSTL